ncbi:MAG: hypothetical protein GVY35_09395 [Bacteroidetes bacterium]|jgi:hypothetical protein|nr:hypothetical protein [Bacteroidota bacterium]
MQHFTRRSFFLLVALAAIVAACDSNGMDDTPVTNRFRVEIANVQDETQGAPFPLLKSGAFDTRAGSGEQGPVRPGEAYEITFTAGPNALPGVGAQFSFATMFVQSNDLFYAFEPGGIPLFESSGTPVGLDAPADVTDEVALWDAGTETDEAPGTGANQAPRQSGPDTGADENGTIVRVENTDSDPALEDSGFEYPPVADAIRVTISSQEDDASGAYAFTVRIENVGDETGTQVNGAPLVISPGTYAVHFDETPGGDDVGFFPNGAAASDGIEAIAEDGMPGPHAQALSALTGVTVPLSPGAFAVHTGDVPFFADGDAAGPGIEDIAEDGIPAALADALPDISGVQSSGAFGVDGGASTTIGPIGPGGSYTFEIEAAPGDRFSFATMYVQSNDLFYAFAPRGVALYDSNDMPISGDVTSEVALWDAGTEVDEEPGVGLNQIIRSAPDTGPDEGGTIVEVQGQDDGFTYPPTNEIIRVTITPQ